MSDMFIGIMSGTSADAIDGAAVSFTDRQVKIHAVQSDPIEATLRQRITDVMRRDSTGKFYDEIYAPELLEAIYRSFRWMFGNGQPLRTHGESFYPDRNFYTYEALNLPLSTDGETIDMVFGGLVFHPKIPPGAAPDPDLG